MICEFRATLQGWSASALLAARRREGAQRLADTLLSCSMVSSLEGRALRLWRHYCYRTAKIERVQLRFAQKGDLGPSAVFIWQYPACVIAAFAKWRRWSGWAKREAPRAVQALGAATRRLQGRAGLARLRLVSRMACRAEGRQERLLRRSLVAIQRNRNLAVARARVEGRNKVRREFKHWFTLARLSRAAREANSMSPKIISLKRRAAVQLLVLTLTPRVQLRLLYALNRCKEKVMLSASLLRLERQRMVSEDAAGMVRKEGEALAAALENEKVRNVHIEAYLKHVIDETHRKLQQAEAELNQSAIRHHRDVEELAGRFAEKEAAMERRQDQGRVVAVFMLWRLRSKVCRNAVIRLRRVIERWWQQFIRAQMRAIWRALMQVVEMRRVYAEAVVKGADLLWRQALRVRLAEAFKSLQTTEPSHACVVIRHTAGVEESLSRCMRRGQLRAAVGQWRVIVAVVVRKCSACGFLFRAVARVVNVHTRYVIAELKQRLVERQNRNEEECRVLAVFVYTVIRVNLRRGLSSWRAWTRSTANGDASMKAATIHRKTTALVAMACRSGSRQMYWRALLMASRASQLERAHRLARATHERRQNTYRNVLTSWARFCRRMLAVRRLRRVLGRMVREALRRAMGALLAARQAAERKRRSLVCLSDRLQLFAAHRMRSYLSFWQATVFRLKYVDLAQRSLGVARMARGKRRALARLRGLVKFRTVVSGLVSALKRALLRLAVYWLRKQILKGRTARFLTSTVQQVALKHRLQQRAVGLVTSLSEEVTCRQLKAVFLAWRRYIELVRSKLTIALKGVARNHRCSTRYAWKRWIGYVGSQLRNQSAWAALRQRRENSSSLGLVVLAKVLQRIK